MRQLLLLPLLACVAACSSPTTSEQATTSPVSTDSSAAAVEPMDTARPASVDARADTLLTANAAHIFSSPATPDKFSLVLRGASVLTGEATFTITNATGQVIFREVLSSPDLEAAMVYDMKGPTATQAERESYVRRRVQEFFSDKNFQKPAVAKSATFPAASEAPTGTDRAAWDDLRTRTDAVSFRYLVGKEDRHTIAWSPLRKQVVRLP